MKTVDDIIESYRVITGACEHGVHNFVESKGKIPAKMKIKYVIEMTRGEFGNEEFAKFFKGDK